MLVFHFAPDLSLLWFYCLADQLMWSYRPQCVVVFFVCFVFPWIEVGGGILEWSYLSVTIIKIKVTVRACMIKIRVFTIILFSGLMNLLQPSIGM